MGVAPITSARPTAARQDQEAQPAVVVAGALVHRMVDLTHPEPGDGTLDWSRDGRVIGVCCLLALLSG